MFSGCDDRGGSEGGNCSSSCSPTCVQSDEFVDESSILGAMLLQVQDAGYDGIHDEAGYLRHYGQSIDFIDANPKPQALANPGVPREDPRDASPELVLVIRTPA